LIDLFYAVCAGAADITFVLDSSGSVGWFNWIKVINFVRTAVNELYIARDGVRVALISYSNYSRIQFKLDAYDTKQKLLNVLDENHLEFLEMQTNTSGALRMMREEVFGDIGNRLNVRDIAIVITDGISTIEKNQLTEQARKVHDAGIRTFGIGIGAAINPQLNQELVHIGSYPEQDHVFSITDFNDLTKLEKVLVTRTCREAPPGESYYFFFLLLPWLQN
jgi:hypothetical protein